MKRCIICDFTTEEGSDYADLPPGIFKLHEHNGDFLCDECLNQYEENLHDITPEEDENPQD